MRTFYSYIRSLYIFHGSSIKRASDGVWVLQLAAEYTLSGNFTQELTGSCWNLGILPLCRVSHVTGRIAKLFQ